MSGTTLGMMIADVPAVFLGETLSRRISLGVPTVFAGDATVPR